MNKAIVQNKSDVKIHGLPPGGSKAIDVDENGIPLDMHWRRRVADSVIDGKIILRQNKTNGKPTKKE